jgi:hypothetical protein
MQCALLAHPLCVLLQVWSCQSLRDRLTIRFGSVQSALAGARARTEAKLQFPEHLPGLLRTTIGHLELFLTHLSHRKG